MSSSPPQTGSARQTKTPGGERQSIVLPAVIAALLIVGGAVAYKFSQGSPPPPPPATTSAPTAAKPEVRPIQPREETAVAPAGPVAETRQSAVKTSVPEAAPSAPAVDARQLMVSLTSLDLKGPITADDAQKWKASLKQLVAQGPSSVTAIRDYLAQNLDVNYTGVEGADQLGYTSLRAGLVDALIQIGGPEATTAMVQTMQTTQFGGDVVAIAAALQQQAPGQYDGDILNAVRTQLAAASQDPSGATSVGPLFQLLAGAAANGTDVTADLAKFGASWPYYAAIELSNLPNALGVPALIQMAQNNNGASQTAAAQALAQLAPQNSQALSALLSMANQGQLSDSALAQIAPYLGGRENELGPAENPPGSSIQGLHIANGNQDFAAADLLNSLSQDQITERISIIDQLLQSIPSDDAQAQQALQQQRGNLAGRQAK